MSDELKLLFSQDWQGDACKSLATIAGYWLDVRLESGSAIWRWSVNCTGLDFAWGEAVSIEAAQERAKKAVADNMRHCLRVLEPDGERAAWVDRDAAREAAKDALDPPHERRFQGMAAMQSADPDASQRAALERATSDFAGDERETKEVKLP